MRVVEKLKKAYNRLSDRLRCFWGRDRWTTRPNEIYGDVAVYENVKRLKAFYRNPTIKNIAVFGGETVGKTSTIMTFEKTRGISIGKFIWIDFRSFVNRYRDSESLHDNIEAFILDRIKIRARQGELPGQDDLLVRGSERTKIRPWFRLVVLILAITMLYAKNQWIDYLIHYLPKTWEPSGIHLAVWGMGILIILVSGRSIIKSFVASPPKNIKFDFPPLKAKGSIEYSGDKNTKQDEKKNRIIYILKKIRWKIGHTIVFDNLDEFDDVCFTSAITCLRDLNKDINDHVQAWRSWNIARLIRPIRFIYIFRSDKVLYRPSEPVFDDHIEIPPVLTVDNILRELENALSVEISGIPFPKEKLFPVDYDYDVNISKHLVNRRLFHETVRQTIKRFDDYSKRIQTELDEDDVSALFSFVLYSLLFQKDFSKFANQTSVVFTGSRDRKDIDPNYCELFEYLISEQCPEKYRITPLCMRFIGVKPERKENLFEDCKKAYDAGDYKAALVLVERALRCDPGNKDFKSMKSKIIRKKGKAYE